MNLKEQIQKPFDAKAFVKDTLTLPPNLAGLNRRSAVVDALALRIENGLRFCKAGLRKAAGYERPEYRAAIKELGEIREELILPYKSDYSRVSTRPSGQKPYNSRYGFAVINGDGVPQPIYTTAYA